jgi:ATP-binding cassette subfamily B protein
VTRPVPSALDIVRSALVALLLSWRSGRMPAAGYAATAVLLGAVPTATAWLTKTMIDDLTGGVRTALVAATAAGLASVELVAVALNRGGEYARAELNRRIDLRIQDDLYRAVNRMDGLRRLESPDFRDQLELARRASGPAISPATTGLYDIARNLIALIGLVGTLAALSPPIAGIVLVAGVPALGAQLSLSRAGFSLTAGLSPTMRRQFFFTSLLVDLRAAKEIRLFGLGGLLAGRVRQHTMTAQSAQRRLDQRTLRIQTLLGALSSATAGVGLLWAVHLVATNRLTVGGIAAFIAAVAGVQSALSGLVHQVTEAHGALGLFGYFRALTSTANDLPVPADPRALPPLRQGIELRDVWFRYGDDQPWVLRGVTLTIPRGATVALVGLNGAGKSTLIKLLCRLYDPSHGSVRWDGTDIRTMQVSELRERIGVLFQDFMTYDLTAAENIGLGNVRHIDDREGIETAGKAAGIHDTLAGLPRGYDTMLSRVFVDGDADEGVLLSGGQWQRVALARTLMAGRRDLLILDEPAAGLDPEAEQELHERIRQHHSGQTAVLISHRMAAVRHADKIVVLAGGRIVEQGNHESLLALGGEYARLFNIQARGYAPSAPEPAVFSEVVGHGFDPNRFE